VLRADIVQHFPSLDHAFLRAEIARVVGDVDILWPVDQILASGAGILMDESVKDDSIRWWSILLHEVTGKERLVEISLKVAD
jgi:hypothetical protein